MNEARVVPDACYGVVQREQTASELDEVAHEVRRLGYAVLDAGHGPDELAAISAEFDRTREHYIAEHGAERLRAMDEYHTIRAPLTHGGAEFLQLACNDRLLAVVRKLIAGEFILNQQNGIINPPRERYNQGSWHRDLPYQHFVSSRPLAVNAVYCVDDFTEENGSTFVLPASHKAEAFPSDAFLRRHALQVEARAGQYILLDCMTFHCGGFNRSARVRRAVNHVFTIPFFKQQIRLPGNLGRVELGEAQKKLLGFNYLEPESIPAYLGGREGKTK